MLFHVGALWRLNELAYLPQIGRVSSVSGGSITAGVLALRWTRLGFVNGIATNFNDLVVTPIREMASNTIDVPDVLKGIFLPGTIADHVTQSYRSHLFGTATLQDLPDAPRFVFNATNVQSGALWRFSKPFMADWRVGLVRNPQVQIAVAVAASSAFPPVLSPLRLDLNPSDFEPGTGDSLEYPPYTTQAVLTDGGVYDNLGLETAWKNYRTVLVSDGGIHVAPEPTPHTDWALHALRINELIDNQVRDLRQRQLIDSFKIADTTNPNRRTGAYWATRSDIARYTVPGVLPCPLSATQQLATIPTRLSALDDGTKERLINWGYAICDAAMRKYVVSTAPPPSGFPFPAGV